MNIFDKIFLTIIVLLIIFQIISLAIAFIRKDTWSSWFYISGVTFEIIIVILIMAIPIFLVLDKASGTTIGVITSIDKNFFGTTALYIKTTETKEEEYCIEYDEELENQAKELIGKKVKISYGKRVGIYSTSKCHQAPIETIELIEENKNE